MKTPAETTTCVLWRPLYSLISTKPLKKNIRSLTWPNVYLSSCRTAEKQLNLQSHVERQTTRKSPFHSFGFVPLTFSLFNCPKFECERLAALLGKCNVDGIMSNVTCPYAFVRDHPGRGMTPWNPRAFVQRRLQMPPIQKQDFLTKIYKEPSPILRLFYLPQLFCICYIKLCLWELIKYK